VSEGFNEAWNLIGGSTNQQRNEFKPLNAKGPKETRKTGANLRLLKTIHTEERGSRADQKASLGKLHGRKTGKKYT